MKQFCLGLFAGVLLVMLFWSHPDFNQACHRIHAPNIVAALILGFFLIWAMKVVIGKQPYDKTNLIPYCHFCQREMRYCACPREGRRGMEFTEWRSVPSKTVELEKERVRTIRTIRTIQETCDIPNAAALANKAIAEGWSSDHYLAELNLQK